MTFYKKNRAKYLLFTIILLILIRIAGCKLSDRDLLAPPEETYTSIPVSITKWYDDHKAALSLTEDHGWRYFDINKKVIQVLMNYKITMDFDLVTNDLLNDSNLVNYVNNYLLPNGFGFFGHGHTHVNHDLLTYDESFASFRKCYECMNDLGIKPVAYAYTGGWGFLLKTRTALKDAGFLCGRRFDELDNVLDPYIMPDTALQPKNWFALPSLTMQSIDYQGNVTCVNNTDELITYLDEAVEKNAWLISTYHFIGNLAEWGYYELSEFENDLRAIKNRDIWCAHLADVILYVYERKSTKVDVLLVKNSNGDPIKIKINLSDGLPNDYYSQPLTIKFEIPTVWINKNLILKSGDNVEHLNGINTKEVKISFIPNDIKDYYSIELN
jgi:hypothetical protein